VSQFPDNLRTLKRYLVQKTGRGGENFSVRGFVGPKRDDGYHLGLADITGPGGRGLWDAKANPDGDYSTRRPRDRCCITNFASAIDITLRKADMQKLTAWMEREAKAGRLDLMEFLGPGPDGRAYWWDRRRKWEPVRLSKGNSHEDHIHASYPRERIPNDDLVAEWEPYFGPRAEPLPEVPDDEPEPSDEGQDAAALRARVEELEDELEEHTRLVQTVLNAAGAEPPLTVDGVFGSKTEAALRQVAQRYAALEKGTQALISSTNVMVAGVEREIAAWRERQP
jgi:hypothetical protein